MSRGSFVISELLTLWRSVVDSGYARRFVETGEGFGLEAYTQGMAQLERMSKAIDRTVQSMFILPHSSQTDEPSSGAARATVTLTISRSAFIERMFAFSPGDVFFLEETTDAGDTGPTTVLTGRRYVVLSAASIGPGELGPIEVEAVATRAGRANNNAQSGNIRRFDQPAAGFSNDLASVELSGAIWTMVAAPNPDVPSSNHVGAYVMFTLGQNIGEVRRIVGYIGPEPDGPDPNGGSFQLAATGQWQFITSAGTFQVGEPVSGPFGEGVLWYFNDTTDKRVAIDVTQGALETGDTVTGAVSGATVVLGIVEQKPTLIPETKTASWRVLDWEVDLGMVVTNVISPEGGRVAMLDTLGRERDVNRADGETDEPYRKRVVTPADVVSPNAVIRAGNRVLNPLGDTVVLREVGLELFRGIFYDGNPGSTDPQYAFAYDLDFDVRPDDALKLALTYEEFRAFFLLGVPKYGDGDFGIAYDDGTTNAFDASPWLAFADGFPVTAASRYKQIWQAVNKIKAGGVGFDLYLE